MKFTFTYEDFRISDRLRRKVSEERISEAVLYGAERIVEAIKIELAPHTKTGKTQQSFVAELVAPGRAIVRSNRKVSQYLDTGTRPHMIYPRNKKWLRYPAGINSPRNTPKRPRSNPRRATRREGWAFSKAVSHPGTRALHYINEAIGVTRKEVIEAVKRVLRE